MTCERVHDHAGPGEFSVVVADACVRAQRLADEGASTRDILTCLASAADRVSGGTASILVIDESGLLRNGSSPQLPADYLDAIDGLKPDPGIGTCAAAAATGNIVFTPSFLADSKWAELRHLPLALGFVGAWSVPIKSVADGGVLGTFGTYLRETREPTTEEIRAIRELASAAARVLEAAACPSVSA